MSAWRFRHPEDVGDLIANDVGASFVLPKSEGADPDVIELFHAGDRMTINAATGEMEFDSVNPGAFATSRLSLKLHQWFAKGVIRPVEN